MRGARAQRDGDPAGVSRLGWDSLGVCAHPTPSSCWGTGTPPPESTQAGHPQEASACLPGWGWGGAAVRSPRGGAGGAGRRRFHVGRLWATEWSGVSGLKVLVIPVTVVKWGLFMVSRRVLWVVWLCRSQNSLPCSSRGTYPKKKLACAVDGARGAEATVTSEGRPGHRRGDA